MSKETDRRVEEKLDRHVRKGLKSFKKERKLGITEKLNKIELTGAVDPTQLVSVIEWRDCYMCNRTINILGIRQSQIKFVLDKLNWYVDNKPSIYVVSMHTIKNIMFPVYYCKIVDVEILMKNATKYWTVSVKAKKDINFLSIFNFYAPRSYEDKDPCDWAGMKGWLFDSYEENKKEFTMNIVGDIELYVFFKVMIAHLT